MEKHEREELLEMLLAEFKDEDDWGPAKLREAIRTHFADYDALEERLEGMTLSSEAAHTYAVELEAKLAEAEKDRERLDWLECMKDRSMPVRCPKSGDWFIYAIDAADDVTNKKTLREAIDAAREGE